MYMTIFDAHVHAMNFDRKKPLVPSWLLEEAEAVLAAMSRNET